MRAAVLLLISCIISFSQIGPVNPGGGGGGSATPGGASGAVQYNNAGALGGDAAKQFVNDTALLPAAPTVTRTGTIGAQACSYKVVAHNALGQSVLSAAGTVTTCALIGIDNTVTLPNTPGATTMDVYISTAPAGGTAGFLAGGLTPGATYHDTTGLGDIYNTGPVSDGTVGQLLDGSLRGNPTSTKESSWRIGPPDTAHKDPYGYYCGNTQAYFPGGCGLKYNFFSLDDIPDNGVGDQDVTGLLGVRRVMSHIPSDFAGAAYFELLTTTDETEPILTASGNTVNIDHEGTGTFQNLYGYYSFVANESSISPTGYLWGGRMESANYATTDKMAGDAGITFNYGNVLTFETGLRAEVNQNRGSAITGDVMGVYVESPHNDGAAHSYGVLIDDDFNVTNGWQLYAKGAGERSRLEGLLELGDHTLAALNLLTIPSGSQSYCVDCTVTSGIDDTCAGSGSGAYVNKVNGVLRCRI